MKKLYNISLFITLLFTATIIFAQQTEREKGIEYYNNGEYQKAVETLQKIVETDKEDKQSWLYLGMSQTKLKNKSQAAKAFKKADKISDEEKQPDNTQTKLKIISKPRAAYTDEARASMTQGTIKLAVEFGADGSIKSIFPFQTLPYGLTENCVESAKNIKFEPATKDGKAYSTIGILSYSFTIY
jgi:tetratricopeptide (TPR) repeat protein